LSLISLMKLPEKIRRVVAAVLGLTGLILSHAAPEFFKNTYVIEDGFIEWLTVVALIASSILMLRRAVSLGQVRSRLFLFVTVAAAAVFIFGAGEEISWGQRIFLIETPDWLAEKNKQRELNLHNLVIGGVSINKLVFSKILGVVLLVYLIIIPLVYRKHPGRAQQIDALGIPLPRTWHVIVWISVLIVTETLVATTKRGELREFLLCTILFVQLLRPFNYWIYDPAKRLEGKSPVA